MVYSDLIEVRTLIRQEYDIMQAKALLHKLIRESCMPLHATRRMALESMVWAAIECRTLTVTALGRALANRCLEKHAIKCADRLLSNRALQAEGEGIYGELAHRLVGRQPHPIILVDWSDLDPWRRNQVLRASLAMEGRALTLYEEVHGRMTAVKRKTHTLFLQKLKQLMPAGCQPVLVTDAGFKAPWFQAVEALGWYWVARVRNPCYVRFAGTDAWQAIKTLYGKATTRARHMGAVELIRSQGHRCQLVLYRARAQGRRIINRYGKHSRSHRSMKAARGVREPWVLASNLPVRFKYAGKVVRLYRCRMQIEESFRDVKSAHYGLGLEFHRSRDPKRVAVLLLIATLALLVIWLIGRVARERGLARQYQANTVRHRAVLSDVFLGARVIERAPLHFMAAEIENIWQSIARLNIKVWGDAL